MVYLCLRLESEQNRRFIVRFVKILVKWRRWWLGEQQMVTKRDVVNEQMQKVAKKRRFHNRCYVCWKKYGKGFHFHHLWYVEGEPIYSDYRNSTDYRIDVMPYIRKSPQQFLLLCTAHHRMVEWLAKMGNVKFRRLCKARRLTQNGKI